MDEVAAARIQTLGQDAADDESRPLENQLCRGLCSLTMEEWTAKLIGFHLLRKVMRLLHNGEMVLRFTNTTPLPVDLIWCDYYNRLVFYAPIEPGCSLCVLCSSLHNWEVVANDGTDCLLNCQDVLRCSALGRRVQDYVVRISLPVSSLRDTTVQFINRLLPDVRAVSELPLPDELKRDLFLQNMVCQPRRYYAFDSGSGTVYRDYSMWPSPPQIVHDNPINEYSHSGRIYN